MRLLAAFVRLPRGQRAVVLEAVACLALASVLVHRVPMRYWRGSLNAAGADIAGAAVRREFSRSVGRAVRRVARRLSFEPACLPQAMAAQWMLRRRHVSSHMVFGVRRRSPGRPTDYHAWLTVDGERVLGGRNAGAFTPLPSLSQHQAPRNRD